MSNRFRNIIGHNPNGKPVQIDLSLHMIIPDDMKWAFDDEGYYEKNVIHWLKRLVAETKQPVFYDIGANYGFYSLMLSSSCSAVYAFEPVKSTFKILKKNISINKLKNVKLVRAAIGSEHKVGYINIYSSSGNNSTYKRNIPANHPTKFLKKEEIKFIKLSDYSLANSLLPPTLMKIDVEGGELDVLRGAKTLIEKYMPTIVIEYSDNTSRDAGYDRSLIYTELKNAGYNLYGLSEDAKDLKLYSPSTRTVHVDNLIASSRKIRK